MLRKYLFKGETVINDDVIFTQMGLSEMSAIFTAINHDLVTVTMKFDFRFMNQHLFPHDIALAANACLLKTVVLLESTIYAKYRGKQLLLTMR